MERTTIFLATFGERSLSILSWDSAGLLVFVISPQRASVAGVVPSLICSSIYAQSSGQHFPVIFP